MDPLREQAFYPERNVWVLILGRLIGCRVAHLCCLFGPSDFGLHVAVNERASLYPVLQPPSHGAHPALISSQSKCSPFKDIELQRWATSLCSVGDFCIQKMKIEANVRLPIMLSVFMNY